MDISCGVVASEYHGRMFDNPYKMTPLIRDLFLEKLELCLTYKKI